MVLWTRCPPFPTADTQAIWRIGSLSVTRAKDPLGLDKTLTSRSSSHPALCPRGSPLRTVSLGLLFPWLLVRLSQWEASTGSQRARQQDISWHASLPAPSQQCCYRSAISLNWRSQLLSPGSPHSSLSVWVPHATPSPWPSRPTMKMEPLPPVPLHPVPLPTPCPQLWNCPFIKFSLNDPIWGAICYLPGPG